MTPSCVLSGVGQLLKSITNGWQHPVNYRGNLSGSCCHGVWLRCLRVHWFTTPWYESCHRVPRHKGNLRPTEADWMSHWRYVMGKWLELKLWFVYIYIYMKLNLVNIFHRALTTKPTDMVPGDLVDVNSKVGNGLVLSGDKPILNPILIRIYYAIWRPMPYGIIDPGTWDSGYAAMAWLIRCLGSRKR